MLNHAKITIVSVKFTRTCSQNSRAHKQTISHPQTNRGFRFRTRVERKPGRWKTDVGCPTPRMRNLAKTEEKFWPDKKGKAICSPFRKRPIHSDAKGAVPDYISWNTMELI